VHHDFAGSNFLFIPIMVIPLALIVPLRPLKAAWMSLALFAANFILGPMSNRIHGSRYDTSFIGGTPGGGQKLAFLLSLAGATAAVTAAICFLRLKFRKQSVVGSTAPVSSGLASELERLAQLRTSGALSEDEFQRAKDKLLARDS
jgi:hypothetical protein